VSEREKTTLMPPAADGGYQRVRHGDERPEKLGALVTVRLTAAQMHELQTKAASENVTAPGFLRNLLLRALQD